ncbi:hypothetical protein [Sinosporangium siamense]|uniref:Uncharacterized protein n=1 Tax=Sinosporangium siamense TaxID=1367973 RepID=A0A919V463_9ACTN|nr:hypothetical protein [Sinosporangium siamense]GII90213.1 hypothetical protein Ssi02_04440 [Sinosporangium siamense]
MASAAPADAASVTAVSAGAASITAASAGAVSAVAFLADAALAEVDFLADEEVRAVAPAVFLAVLLVMLLAVPVSGSLAGSAAALPDAVPSVASAATRLAEDARRPVAVRLAGVEAVGAGVPVVPASAVPPSAALAAFALVLGLEGAGSPDAVAGVSAAGLGLRVRFAAPAVVVVALPGFAAVPSPAATSLSLSVTAVSWFSEGPPGRVRRALAALPPVVLPPLRRLCSLLSLISPSCLETLPEEPPGGRAYGRERLPETINARLLQEATGLRPTPPR